jgi:hypothetical protein
MAQAQYDAILPAADPAVKCFREDLLKYDLEIIAGLPAVVSFIHYAGECGTHIIVLWPADSDNYPAPGVRVPYLFGHADRWHILRQRIALAEALYQYRQSKPVVQYWDGWKLRSITHADAVRLASEHVARIAKTWRAEQVPA